MQGSLRYVVFAFMAAGMLLWITLAKLFAALAYTLNVSNPALLGDEVTLANVLGLAIATGAGFWAFRHPALREYSLDVISELRKVTWPTRRETQAATVVVIVATIIVAVILGAFDTLWAKLTGIIYSR